MPVERMEGTCMELALEGERLCKNGDCRTGVQFFEAAVRVGTDDLKTLSAVYSQLGNAYFYLQDYTKALEYHRHDLNLARTLSDKPGEAKASGNLGNTLKVLGQFDEAIACCQRHLDISRELTDKVGEARALYNLGNVHHAKGKHAGRSANQDPGEFPPEVKESLQKAADYYESNLKIVRELGDRAAQGRACGNLGNTHYLLGNFKHAIMYHEERLSIAKEFGDKSAERRAYSNLGNAHIFLGDFDTAAEQYTKTLQIAKQLGDKALEAQACYSLGNTYTLLRDYERAIEYHSRHLQIAQELEDRVGEGRACWSLGNAHMALGNHERALHFASQHYDISEEIGDRTGQATAQVNMADLKVMLGIQSDTSQASIDNVSLNTTTSSQDDGNKLNASHRRRSMENLELVHLTPEKREERERAAASTGARPKVRVQKAATISHDMDFPPGMEEGVTPSGVTGGAAQGPGGRQENHVQTQQPKPVMPPGRKGSGELLEKQSKSMDDADNFFNMITKFQSRRMDEQRCSLRIGPGHGPSANRAAAPHSNSRPGAIGGAMGNDVRKDRDNKQTDDFLELVAGLQANRMNDQRATLPDFPGLRKSQQLQEILAQRPTPQRPVVTPTMPDDTFFEMLMRCQGTRLEDQRSALPDVKPRAPTVPDEDFFSLIQRVQSSRLEEQRSSLPKNQDSSSKNPDSAKNSKDSSNKESVSRKASQKSTNSVDSNEKERQGSKKKKK